MNRMRIREEIKEIEARRDAILSVIEGSIEPAGSDGKLSRCVRCGATSSSVCAIDASHLANCVVLSLRKKSRHYQDAYYRLYERSLTSRQRRWWNS